MLSYAVDVWWLDEMSLEILKKGKAVFIEEDIDVLWERAQNDDTVPYAFMYGE